MKLTKKSQSGWNIWPPCPASIKKEIKPSGWWQRALTHLASTPRFEVDLAGLASIVTNKNKNLWQENG